MSLRNNQIINTDASLSVGREFVSRVADAFKWAIHIDTFTVVAHACLPTFVHVDAKRTDGRTGKSFLADAFEWARDILASTVETNAGIFSALVQICTQWFIYELFMSL